jgi:hypothetical protein
MQEDKENSSDATTSAARKRKASVVPDSVLSFVNIKRWCEVQDKDDQHEREYMADDEQDSGDEDARKFAEGIKKKRALKEFNDLVKKIKSTKI